MLKLLFNHFTHSQIPPFAYRNFYSLVCVFRQDQAVFQQKGLFKSAVMSYLNSSWAPFRVQLVMVYTSLSVAVVLPFAFEVDSELPLFSAHITSW